MARTFKWLMLAVLFVCSLTACGVAATPPPAMPALSPPVLTTLGDSITAGAYGSNYVDALAAGLGAKLTNLGIGGEFSGPIDYHLINGTAHLVYGGILADEVGKIPLDSTIVTLYVGTNDLWLSNDGVAPDFLNAASLAQAAADRYARNIPPIIAGIRARVPMAKIFLATVPNPAWRPVNLSENGLLRASSTLMAKSIKSTLVATNLPIVDLLCEPGMYDDANFGGIYDVHPVARGFSVIAADFLTEIQNPQPSLHCKYESV